MRTFITILLGLVSLTVHGQVTNTIHRDETNIYYHVLDTAVKIIQTKITPKKIKVEGDAFNRLPDNISGIAILKTTEKRRIKDKEADAIITINKLEIDRGEFRIFVQLWTVENDDRRILEKGFGSYSFNYEFVTTDKSFRLIRIDKGIMIR